MATTIKKFGLLLLLITLSACAYNPRYGNAHPNNGYYPGYGNNGYYPQPHPSHQPRPPAYGWRNMRPSQPNYRPPNNNYYYQNNVYNRPVPGYYGHDRHDDHHEHYEHHDEGHGHGHHGRGNWRGDDD